MILKGSQRGSATQLARHLMNLQENEHVELHELRGFATERLIDALSEAEAVAKGTRCKQFLFSLSLNPPEGAEVDIATFETAIEMAESRLGLDGLPRAVVFHEKEGRRHAHAVWSRIDPATMTARNLPFFKTRLMEVAKELYLHHEWDIPKGFIDHDLRNPLNFDRAEWQKARRIGHDPRLLKAMFRDAWRGSANAEELRAALENRGFFLARGDRRGVVAVDVRGEVYALARWTGLKTKDVAQRFPNPQALPSVEAVKAIIAERMSEKIRGFLREVDDNHRRLSPSVEFRRVQMVERQREERKALAKRLESRRREEECARAARLPRGFGGIWARITGRYGKIRRQNERETIMAAARADAEKDRLINAQREERRALHRTITRMREDRQRERSELEAELGLYVAARQDDVPKLKEFNKRARSSVEERADVRTIRRDEPGYEL